MIGSSFEISIPSIFKFQGSNLVIIGSSIGVQTDCSYSFASCP